MASSLRIARRGAPTLIVALAALGLMGSRCAEPPPVPNVMAAEAPPAVATPPPAPGGPLADPAAEKQESCLDAAAQKSHLNAFGDPPDTVYPGGSPLMDESTGRTISRRQYIRLHHPELDRQCPEGAPAP